MRILCIVITLLAFTNAAKAAEIEKPLRQNYPSARDIYEQCKEALSLADEQKWKEFYVNPCITSFTAAYSTIYINNYYLDVEPHDEKERHEMDLIKSQWDRWCALRNLAPDEPPELQLAKRFVLFYEKKKDDRPLADNINKPAPGILVDSMRNCKVE